MSLFGLILGTTIGNVVGKGIGNEINIANYKRYDDGMKAIKRKYSTSPHQHPKLGALITASNPKFVEYVRELIEYNNRHGKSTFTTVEGAKEMRKEWVKKWIDAGGQMDSDGYSIDVFGNRI